MLFASWSNRQHWWHWLSTREFTSSWWPFAAAAEADPVIIIIIIFVIITVIVTGVSSTAATCSGLSEFFSPHDITLQVSWRRRLQPGLLFPGLLFPDEAADAAAASIVILASPGVSEFSAPGTVALSFSGGIHRWPDPDFPAEADHRTECFSAKTAAAADVVCCFQTAPASAVSISAR
jgi:hypothetical protein